MSAKLDGLGRVNKTALQRVIFLEGFMLVDDFRYGPGNLFEQVNQSALFLKKAR
jgi:hypothetical protein